MRISELMPRPFRNIYSNYNALQNPLTLSQRSEKIQNITKDVFRIILIIPLGISIIAVTFSSTPEPIKLLFTAALLILSAPSTLLTGSALSGICSIYYLVAAVAKKSFGELAASVIFGIFTVIGSEIYDRYLPNDFILDPLSNRVSRIIV